MGINALQNVIENPMLAEARTEATKAKGEKGGDASKNAADEAKTEEINKKFLPKEATLAVLAPGIQLKSLGNDVKKNINRFNEKQLSLLGSLIVPAQDIDQTKANKKNRNTQSEFDQSKALDESVSENLVSFRDTFLEDYNGLVGKYVQIQKQIREDKGIKDKDPLSKQDQLKVEHEVLALAQKRGINLKACKSFISYANATGDYPFKTYDKYNSIYVTDKNRGVLQSYIPSYVAGEENPMVYSVALQIILHKDNSDKFFAKPLSSAPKFVG